MPNIEEFLSRLGLKIKNIDLYVLAFTHPSYNSDAKTKHHDYERLEYMGDAVLGFVSADLIYKYHPEMNQGLMSKLRSKIVSGISLAKYARTASFANYILTGQSIDAAKINESNKILEDVFEAVIGAIYLDLGINVAYKYIESFIKNDILNVDELSLTDAKTRLQEEMQAEHRDSVTYEVINISGPAHDRKFKVNVLFNGLVLASGEGKSKKMAEEAAAEAALRKRSI